MGIISALFGGVGVRGLDYFLNKENIHEAEARFAREELRTEIKCLKIELEEERKRSDEIDKKLDDLREKYYRLIERVLMSYKSDEAKIELLTDIHEELVSRAHQ